ncbi:hypothetical protein EMCRGX_G012305 [Ephydatia muelleri]
MTTDVWAISRYEPELEASDLGCEGFEDAEILGCSAITTPLTTMAVCKQRSSIMRKVTRIEHYVNKIDAKLDQLICNQNQGLARQAHPQYRQAEVTAAMQTTQPVTVVCDKDTDEVTFYGVRSSLQAEVTLLWGKVFITSRGATVAVCFLDLSAEALEVLVGLSVMAYTSPPGAWEHTFASFGLPYDNHHNYNDNYNDNNSSTSSNYTTNGSSIDSSSDSSNDSVIVSCKSPMIRTGWLATIGLTCIPNHEAGRAIGVYKPRYKPRGMMGTSPEEWVQAQRDDGYKPRGMMGTSPEG